MKFASIDFEYIDDESVATECRRMALKCPACGKHWIEKMHGGEYFQDENYACPHLKFFMLEGEPVEYFNGLTEKELMAAVEPVILTLKTGRRAITVAQYFESNRFCKDLWEKASSPAFDAVLDFTDSGFACGPVCMTAYYGVKLSNDPQPTGSNIPDPAASKMPPLIQPQ